MLKDIYFSMSRVLLSCFVKTRSPKSIVLPGMSELISKNRKVFWEEKSCQQIPLSFDGVPFFVLGTQLRECCHGPDRHQAKKRTAAAETSRMGDHEYSALRSKRLLTQNTKKLNCPACIYLRSVICFPMYKIPENGKWAKRKGSKELLAALRNTEEVVSEYRVYVALPSNDTHSNHLSDEAGSMSHSVDKRVVGKIHSLVHDGVRDEGEMRRHIMSFSKTNFPGVTESSNRFFPNNRCLRNHMYAALSLSQFSREDQENLQQHVTAWRNENPDDSFYFVPSNFLTKRLEKGIEENILPHGWTVETVPHSKQFDSSSCGIYVIKFAEMYLCDNYEKMTFTSKSLKMERRKIQLKLLSVGIEEQEMLAHAVDEASGRGHMKAHEEEMTIEQHKEVTHQEVTHKRKRKDKVKEDNPECPSLSEVEEDILGKIGEEESDPFDELLLGDLQDIQSDLTPVALNSPAVQFFKDLQKQKGHILDVKQTGWGPFVLLSAELFDEYLLFRKHLCVDDLLTICAPLRFFLHKYGSEINVMYVSENVVRLDPVNAIEQYKEWFNEIKQKLLV